MYQVDANGKKNSWECVVCIPFIKEDVLVGTINDIDHLATLTETERIRNVPGERRTSSYSSYYNHFIHSRSSSFIMMMRMLLQMMMMMMMM